LGCTARGWARSACAPGTLTNAHGSHTLRSCASMQIPECPTIYPTPEEWEDFETVIKQASISEKSSIE